MPQSQFAQQAKQPSPRLGICKHRRPRRCRSGRLQRPHLKNSDPMCPSSEPRRGPVGPFGELGTRPRR
eukprot:4405114-Alexandrium_andersonii.AAC.1